MLGLIDRVDDCFKFISECKAIFDCALKTQPCDSSELGSETSFGFKTNVKPSFLEIRRCHHWGVQLLEHDGQIFCSANGEFRFDSQHNFCSSYILVCQKLLKCLTSNLTCPLGNHSISQVHADIFFDYPPPIAWDLDQDDPRDLIPLLYSCNRRFGYHRKIHLYFYRENCRFSNCKFPNYFSEEDQRYSTYDNADQRVAISYPYWNTPKRLVWYCRRDILSESTCAEFEQSCKEIAICVKQDFERKKITFEPNSQKFVMDGQCYSPLPLTTDRPLQHFLPLRRFYLKLSTDPGEAISHIMPLEGESFEPIFIPFSYATPKFQYKKYQTEFRNKFFFERFLEDCKYAYKFYQGDLLEGFNVDKVDYLICSLPFGTIKSPANPTIRQGCSHIKEVCENMKKCYINFRKYFNFSQDFKQYMMQSGIIIIVFMSLAFALSVSEFFKVMKLKRFMYEQVTEMLMILILIMASVDLIGYRMMAQHLHKYDENESIFLENIFVEGSTG